MIEEYKRDGYFVARNLLNPGDVGRALEDMCRLVLQQVRSLRVWYSPHDDLHHILQLLLDSDRARYIATLTLCAKLASLWELYLDRDIKFAVDDLGLKLPVFQTQPMLHVMSDKLRIPGGYHGFGQHQDWPTMQGSLDTVTVWLPFTAVGPDNFTMEVAPGSHKAGLYPYTRNANIFKVADCTANFTPIEAQPGDVVFMSAWTVHRSSTRGGGLRIAASMRYENAAEPTFIERGYPCAQKRVVAQELITPDFPSAEQVRQAFE